MNKTQKITPVVKLLKTTENGRSPSRTSAHAKKASSPTFPTRIKKGVSFHEDAF